MGSRGAIDCFLIGVQRLADEAVEEAASRGALDFFLIGATVAISLVWIVLWGAVAGAMLPFVLRRSGFDPASASAPFVSTLVDVTGLVIYFSVATLLLTGTLL